MDPRVKGERVHEPARCANTLFTSASTHTDGALTKCVLSFWSGFWPAGEGGKCAENATPHIKREVPPAVEAWIQGRVEGGQRAAQVEDVDVRVSTRACCETLERFRCTTPRHLRWGNHTSSPISHAKKCPKKCSNTHFKSHFLSSLIPRFILKFTTYVQKGSMFGFVLKNADITG